MNKDLIVARYQEDTSWLSDPRLNEFNILLYNKGKGKNGIKLENVGREAHTYLHHIITNYDKLADINVFTQADPFEHCENFIEKLPLCTGDYYDFGCLNTRAKIEPTQITRKGARTFGWMKQEVLDDLHSILDSLNDTAIKLYRKNNMPPIISVSHFAIFSVSREIIHTHPIELYKRLQQHTIEQENGAYTLELLWRTLFA